MHKTTFAENDLKMTSEIYGRYESARGNWQIPNCLVKGIYG